VRRFILTIGSVVALALASVTPALADHSKDHLLGCPDDFSGPTDGKDGEICIKTVRAPAGGKVIVTEVIIDAVPVQDILHK
jgi:hypothetical protein